MTLALDRGWAMRVKSADHGHYTEVGVNLKTARIRVRVRAGGQQTLSTTLGLDEARLLRRFLGRCIHALVAL